jgi:hypothetical protein
MYIAFGLQTLVHNKYYTEKLLRYKIACFTYIFKLFFLPY